MEGPFASHAGSAWGANPDPDDEKGWQAVYRHADYLGLSWNRVATQQCSYLPEQGVFTWESREMRALYRILDWCQSRGAEVFLQNMWANTYWNAYPGVLQHRSAPPDIEAFAQGCAAFVEHLEKVKKYTCVRWFNITNEPGNDWSWWMDGEGKTVPITPALKATQRAFARRQLKTQLTGPDWTNLPELDEAKIDFDDTLGSYELHSYWEDFGTAKLGESPPEKIMAAWSSFAHARGKPFFLGEYGAMNYGWQYDHPAPGGYLAGLKCAELILRGLNAGVDGFSRWSFTNRGHVDGQWQLIDTWDVKAGALRASFRPHHNSYLLFGLISRLFPLGAKRLTVAVETREMIGHYLVAAGMVSAQGDLTFFVLSNTEQAQPGRFQLPGGFDAPLYRYQVTQADKDRPFRPRRPQKVKRDSDGGLSEIFPGLSLTAFSTKKLGPRELGVV
jgi:hypothetical protein